MGGDADMWAGLGRWSRVRPLLGLAGIPTSKGQAIKYMRHQGWPERQAIGRGGACIEFLIPAEIASAAAALKTAAAAAGNAAEFTRLPRKLQAEAERRLPIMTRYVELRDQGKGASAAARDVGVPYRTVLRWHKLTKDRHRSEWLSLLVPAYSIEAPRADIHPDDWTLFLSLALRTGPATEAQAYRETKRAAAAAGRSVPSSKTFLRRLHEVNPAVVAFKRGGERALDRMFPAQVRDEMVFAAYQALNIDGRKADVFVDWDGRIVRPVIIALQDIRSRMIVAYGVFETESSDGARTVLLDVFDRLGIPEHLWSDNGRFVASKQISGGTAFRYRWRAAVGEALGLLPRLGVQVHFTTPYSGRSKPIERAFRDLAANIENHPEFAGAYCGNKPDAKPEDFTGTPVAKETFLRVYAEGIAEHNQRPGRRTKACAGTLSFEQAFNRSYGIDRPIIQLTAAQRRYFFLAAKPVKADRSTGAITFNGNGYWSQELHAYRGQELRALYDPRNAHAPIIVETTDHRMIAESVPCNRPVGFNDSERVRDQQRAKRRLKRATREAAAALDLLTGARLRDRLVKTPPTQPPAATVVKPFARKPPTADAILQSPKNASVSAWRAFDAHLAAKRSKGS